MNCLGALKNGFVAGKRDFLGLDGAFMKGPYLSQILSTLVNCLFLMFWCFLCLYAVNFISLTCFHGNNGVYPLAYIVVVETLNFWIWFLSHLRDDLGLTTNSNFTFYDR